MELDVYLPGDGNKQTYTHVWSRKVYSGGQTVRVLAPYGKPAVFLVNHATSPDLEDFLEFVRKENNTVIDFGL